MMVGVEWLDFMGIVPLGNCVTIAMNNVAGNDIAGMVIYTFGIMLYYWERGR